MNPPPRWRIADEAERAGVELLHAIDRHRRAWTKMAHLKREAERRGNAFYMDNDRAWKEAVGDVQWWRGEVNARSNSLVALKALDELLYPSLAAPGCAGTVAHVHRASCDDAGGNHVCGYAD